MKADVLPIDGAEHQAVQMLLPWHGSGLLDADETKRVDAHLADCPRCQADLAWQARLRATAAEGPAAAPDPHAADRGWAALRARLAAEMPAAAGATPAARPARRRDPLRLWAFALAVQAALVLVVALSAVWWAMAPRGEPYRALGAAAPNLQANALVVFRPDATEAQVRAALRAGDARIVGGPTVTDAYLLRLAAPDAAALARLRAQGAVLRIESLEGDVPEAAR